MSPASVAIRTDAPPDPSRPPRGSSRAKVLLASGLSLAAAVLAAVSAYAPWWYLSVAGPATSSKVDFFPGNEVLTSTNGGGGVTTYAAAHVPSVGGLYAVVLAGTIAVAVLAGAAAVAGLALGRGRSRSDGLRRAARAAVLAAIGLSVVLVATVALAQPVLYRYDDPMGACGSAHPPPACGSFWGSSAQGSLTTTWGAGAGWWLEVAAVGLLVGALIVGIVHRADDAPVRASNDKPLKEPPGPPRPPSDVDGPRRLAGCQPRPRSTLTRSVTTSHGPARFKPTAVVDWMLDLR